MIKQFSNSIFGYNKKEVDCFLEEMKKDYEEELGKKRIRMLELAEETRAMKLEAQEKGEQLARLVEQEKYVSQALIKAEERAQAIIEDGRKNSALELEKMKLEKDKWWSKLRQVRQELMEFEKTILKVIERFRDDINYYTAKEISETMLIDDMSTEENLSLGLPEDLNDIKGRPRFELSERKKDKEKVIA